MYLDILSTTLKTILEKKQISTDHQELWDVVDSSSCNKTFLVYFYRLVQNDILFTEYSDQTTLSQSLISKLTTTPSIFQSDIHLYLYFLVKYRFPWYIIKMLIHTNNNIDNLNEFVFRLAIEFHSLNILHELTSSVLSNNKKPTFVCNDKTFYQHIFTLFNSPNNKYHTMLHKYIRQHVTYLRNLFTPETYIYIYDASFTCNRPYIKMFVQPHQFEYFYAMVINKKICHIRAWFQEYSQLYQHTFTVAEVSMVFHDLLVTPNRLPFLKSDYKQHIYFPILQLLIRHTNKTTLIALMKEPHLTDQLHFSQSLSIVYNGHVLFKELINRVGKSHVYEMIHTEHESYSCLSNAICYGHLPTIIYLDQITSSRIKQKVYCQFSKSNEVMQRHNGLIGAFHNSDDRVLEFVLSKKIIQPHLLQLFQETKGYIFRCVYKKRAKVKHFIHKLKLLFHALQVTPQFRIKTYYHMWTFVLGDEEWGLYDSLHFTEKFKRMIIYLFSDGATINDSLLLRYHFAPNVTLLQFMLQEGLQRQQILTYANIYCMTESSSIRTLLEAQPDFHSQIKNAPLKAQMNYFLQIIKLPQVETKLALICKWGWQRDQLFAQIAYKQLPWSTMYLLLKYGILPTPLFVCQIYRHTVIDYRKHGHMRPLINAMTVLRKWIQRWKMRRHQFLRHTQQSVYQKVLFELNYKPYHGQQFIHFLNSFTHPELLLNETSSSDCQHHQVTPVFTVPIEMKTFVKQTKAIDHLTTESWLSFHTTHSYFLTQKMDGLFAIVKMDLSNGDSLYLSAEKMSHPFQKNKFIYMVFDVYMEEGFTYSQRMNQLYKYHSEYANQSLLISFGKQYDMIEDLFDDQKKTNKLFKTQFNSSSNTFNWWIKPFYSVSAEMLACERLFTCSSIPTRESVLKTDGFVLIHPFTNRSLKLKNPQQISIDLYITGDDSNFAYVCDQRMNKIRKIHVKNYSVSHTSGIYRYFYSNKMWRITSKRDDKMFTNSLQTVEELLHLVRCSISPNEIISGEIITPF